MMMHCFSGRTKEVVNSYAEPGWGGLFYILHRDSARLISFLSIS